MSIKRILGQVRRAIQDYDMINKGDRIAVGISGGKDSLALLFMLSRLRTFYQQSFDIEAVTVSLDREKEDHSSLSKYCASIGVRHTVVDTYIRKIVFDIRKEQNPCSLCAKLRYGALNNAAIALNCSKVALGHNRDDVIETLMMSLIFEGRLHTFSPVTWLSKTGVHLIRPLIYAEEREIKGFINEYGLPVTKNQCPAAGETKREYVRDLIKQLVRDKHDIKSNLFGVIMRNGINGWKQTEKKQMTKKDGEYI